MAGIYHPSRGGVRGGKDQFNWDDVKTDKDRESYLGHSVMVPTGKWQEGKDLIWYTRGKNNQEKTERERKKKEELQAVKDLERRAMEAALGKKSFSTGTTSLTAKELQEVLSRGKTEHGSEDRIHGVGHKRASNSKAEKYGTSFEGFDAGGRNNRSDSDREPDKKSKKKKKEKKKKKKKLKQQSDGSDDDEAFPRKRRYSSDDGDGKDRRRFLRDSSKRNSGEATKYVNSRRDDERSQYFDTRSHKSEYKDNRHDVTSDSRRNMNLDRRQDTHPNDEKYDRRRNAHADVKMSDRRRDAHADDEKSDRRRSSHPDDRRRNIKSDSRHNERHDEPMNKRQSRRSDSEEDQRNSRKRHSTGERKSNGRSSVKRSRRNSDSD